jgi:hypothetical protein
MKNKLKICVILLIIHLLLVKIIFFFIIFICFFLLAFYKNCLQDLTTHRSDVEYALNNIYQEHCEDIDLTPFVKAMCSHLSLDNQKYKIRNLVFFLTNKMFFLLNRLFEADILCEPTIKHINSYLNEKFLEIINKFFRRVSPDSDYFYFCTDEERFRQSRCSLEIEDRLTNNTNISSEMTSTTSGPYKFDETSENDHETDNDDDHESTDTVHIHDNNDDEDAELPLNSHRSDVSSSSLSNPSRELSMRGDIFPLFICFDCRLIMKDYDYNKPVKTIPLCISKMKKNIKKKENK